MNRLLISLLIVQLIVFCAVNGNRPQAYSDSVDYRRKREVHPAGPCLGRAENLCPEGWDCWKKFCYEESVVEELKNKNVSDDD